MRLVYTVCLVTILSLSINGLYAQESLEEIVQEGIKLHDEGRYDDAVKMYLKALEIDSTSPLVHFEIALTYMYAEEHEKSLKHAEIAADSGEKGIVGSAYTLVGNNLDALGQPDEAIKTFKKALKILGDDHMIYYNMGVTYKNTGDIMKADEALSKGISINPTHSSSHLLLSYVKADQNQKVHSALSMYFFLLLEPHTDRSYDGLELLYEHLYGDEDNDPSSIQITPGLLNDKDPLSSVNLFLSFLPATNEEARKKGASEKALFIENTKSFFKICGELKKKKYKGLFWEHYVDFFYKLAKSKHLEAYCYYITQSERDSIEWLNTHGEDVDAMIEWINNM